jgi:hypothetical protein
MVPPPTENTVSPQAGEMAEQVWGEHNVTVTAASPRNGQNNIRQNHRERTETCSSTGMKAGTPGNTPTR